MCFQRSQVFRQDSPLPPRWPVGNRRRQLLRDIVTEERHGPQLQHGGAPCLEEFRTAAMWHCEPPKPSGLEESFEKSPTLTAAQLPLQIHPEVRYSVILHHPQTSHPTEGRSQCPPQRCSPAAPSQPGCPQRRFGAIFPSAPRTRRVSVPLPPRQRSRSPSSAAPSGRSCSHRYPNCGASAPPADRSRAARSADGFLARSSAFRTRSETRIHPAQ